MNLPTALCSYLKHYPDALDDVVKHFGSNYETLLNFWTYLDTLNGSDHNHLLHLYYDGDPERYKWSTESTDYGRPTLESYADLIIPHQFMVWHCSQVSGIGSHLGYAALEIVAMHKILDDGYTLKTLTIFENL